MGFGKGSSPPPVPDYAALAKATAAGNLDAAKFAAEANRVNQVTPYGSLIYSKGAPPNMPSVGRGGLYTSSGYPRGGSTIPWEGSAGKNKLPAEPSQGQEGKNKLPAEPSQGQTVTPFRRSAPTSGAQPELSPGTWARPARPEPSPGILAQPARPEPTSGSSQELIEYQMPRRYSGVSPAQTVIPPKVPAPTSGAKPAPTSDAEPVLSTGPTVTDNTWTAYTSLSPVEQEKLDRQNELSLGLLDTAGRGLSQVDKMLSDTSLDESRLAQMGISGETVQDAIFSRLTPEFDRQQAGLEQQMANQGIPRGSEAWNRAMEQQGQRRNDMMIQAALQGIDTANRARQQGISEQYTAQSRPLDIINALRTGIQVQNPQFVNVPQQATTAGADLMGAAQAQYGAQMGQYNAKQASNNALMNGLFSLGNTALTGLFGGGED